MIHACTHARIALAKTKTASENAHGSGWLSKFGGAGTKSRNRDLLIAEQLEDRGTTRSPAPFLWTFAGIRPRSPAAGRCILIRKLL